MTAHWLWQTYIYGNSARPYLVAVIVPAEDALASHDTDELKGLISQSLQDVAKKTGLQSYEVPRDFIIETTPFTAENGLLTGIGKMARPKLKERHGDRLEQLYAELAEGQANDLLELRRNGANRPVLRRSAEPQPRFSARRAATSVPMRTSATWAETRCRR